VKKSRIAGTPHGVGVTPNNNGTKDYWKVRLGKKFTGGKIVTRNFDNLTKAREWIFGDAQKLVAAPGAIVTLKKTAGTNTFALSPRELDEAADAFRRCKAAEMTLTEAVSFAIKHHRPTGGKLTIKEAIEELIVWKLRKGKRPRYLEKLKAKLLRFSRSLPTNTMMNEVTQKTIEKYLTKLKQAPQGEVIELRHISVLFGWGHKRGYVADNPSRGIEKPEIERKPPTIFTPGEALDLLKVAAELTPWVAAGLFAGLRPEESQRLDWEDIDFSRRHIDLPAHKSKTRDRRIIPFLGHLEEWLLPYRQPSGLIIPRNFRRHFWAMAERAGYRIPKAKEGDSVRRIAVKRNGKVGTKVKFEGWPKDVLRHCFGSYHLAKWKSAGTTAEFMGHRDAKMLYKHYREVIKNEADVEIFWSLNPEQLRSEGIRKITRAKLAAA
jgi:integrase